MRTSGSEVSGRYLDVAETWRSLDEQANYFFQLPSWAEAFSKYTDSKLIWISSKHRSPSTAVLKLAKTSTGGVPLRVLRNPQFSGVPFIEGIVADGDPRDLLELVPAWHVARLDRLRAKSAWLDVEGGHVLERHGKGVTVLDLPGDRDSWWSNAPKNLRKTIRRRRARAGATGDATYNVVSRPGDIEEALARFIALESSGWKASTGGTLAQKPRLFGLLSEFLEAEADNGSVRIYFLRIGGIDAAFQISVKLRRTLFMLKTTYNERLSELSPGSLLMAHIIEESADDPELERLDFCSTTPWREHWGMAQEPTYQVTVFNEGTARGRLLDLGWRWTPRG